jgi:hypothetical protein
METIIETVVTRRILTGNRELSGLTRPKERDAAISDSASAIEDPDTIYEIILTNRL